MSAETIEIVASNLTLDIPIYDPRARSFRHAMLRPIANTLRGATYIGGNIQKSNGVVVVRAIDNVSFRIDHGERVGIIGHNGAGKTTLLRAMAGIFEPTGGSMMTCGQIMPLFNLMEGLMPESTGREFIRIRGVLLGLEPRQIDPLIDEVAEFCELGDYIDMPVRTYSTGMLVRVAFAVATSVTSDILLFDELIGAGDARFLKKGEERLRRFAQRSSIVVIATHNHDILLKWCTRALLLDHGSLIHDGDVESTLRLHDARLTATTEPAEEPQPADA